MAGNTGKLTLPLVVLMFSVQNCSSWFIADPETRPNLLVYFIRCVPVSVVFTIISLVPPYGVAVPGVLFRGKPLLYSAWCGLGYPFLSFLLRKMALTYFISYALKQVEIGRMQSRGVIPFIATVSFGIGLSLMYGNTMLLYLSENVLYAILSSLCAIFTEVAGKIYAVIAIVSASKLERKIRKMKNSAKGSETIKEGNGRVVGGAAEEFDAESDAEVERKSKDALANQLVLCAVRWTNEIVAEKVCIVICGLTSAFFSESPHSKTTLLMFTLVFIATEFLADALLVWVLVRFFDVPFLKLPREEFAWLDKEFWVGTLEIALVALAGSVAFLHGLGSAREWFPDVDNVVGGLNSTMNATNVTLGDLEGL
jgi:hypothetical protein